MESRYLRSVGRPLHLNIEPTPLEQPFHYFRVFKFATGGDSCLYRGYRFFHKVIPFQFADELLWKFDANLIACTYCICNPCIVIVMSMETDNKI